MLSLARAEGVHEMLDGPVERSDLEETLADMARLNALFGGARITVRHVTALAAALPAGAWLSVVDVGTGYADVPRALVRACRRAGRPVRVLAIDRDRETLDIARAASREYPEIAFVQADALSLPVRPLGVDVTTSSLTLHHLEPGAACRALAAMHAVSRRGAVVNDLARGPGAWLIVWLVTRVLAKNRVSRHDGPLSVRRAYTATEVSGLARSAGIARARVFRYPMVLRLCLVSEKP